MEEKSIWLIEDNTDDIELTMRAFARNRLKNEIVILKDGQLALDYLHGKGQYVGRDTNKLPALILLDLKLPKVDGLEILKEIRSLVKYKYVPVVILTSSLEERDLVTGYSLGANSYIRKPVDFNNFIDAVQQLGVYWLLLNQIPEE